MVQNFLDDDDWELIIPRIREGMCVPFLGAAVNVSSTDGTYEGLPLGGDVSLRLAALWMKLQGVDLKQLTEVQSPENIKQSPRFEDFKDLTRVSLYNLARVALHVQVRRDYRRLIQYLRTLIPEDNCKPSPLLQTLAKLPRPTKATSPPFQLIVTTNYDRLMERALESQGYREERDYKILVQPIDGFSPAAQRKLEKDLATFKGIVLYKIHGSFAGHQNQDTSEVIVTEEDYIEFLTTVLKPKVGVPNLIKGKLVGSTLLFLGYSLEDWDFRTIFKGLIERLPDRKKLTSYAIQYNPPDFWVKIWEKKDVRIRNVDLYKFAEELRQQLGIQIDGDPNGDEEQA
jgi:hypothetical protein